MGIRLRDDFEIRHDEANTRTILENLNTGEQFILNEDGTTTINANTLQGNAPADLKAGITKTDEAVTFEEADVTVTGGAIIKNGSLDTKERYSTNLEYNSVTFDGGTSLGVDIEYNDDGSKLYLLDSNNDTLKEYDLSTNYDITTATYNSVSFNFGGQDQSPTGITWNNDGSKLYLTGYASGGDMYEYDLSTPYDISTATYNSVSTATQNSIPQGLVWNNDGSKLYVLGDNGIIYENDASVNFDLSTLTYNSVSFDTSSEDSVGIDIEFNDDGSKLFLGGDGNDNIYEYELSVNFDISTASYTGNSFDASGQETQLKGIVWNDDGSSILIIGYSSDIVYEYDVIQPSLPSENTVSFDAPTDIFSWDIATFQADEDGGSVTVDVGETFTTEFTQSFDVSAQDGDSRGVEFSSDGTKLYHGGNDNDNVYQYALSTAWDISTASFTQSFDVSGQDTFPTNLTFREDGTQMYVTGSGADSVHEYALSTAWDISTASFTQSFDVSGQTFGPGGIDFRDDGTQMFVSDFDNDRVIDYALSTAWDISSASFTQSFSVGYDFPHTVEFRPNGEELYLIGFNDTTIRKYTLTTPWDISTASLSESYDSSAQATAGVGLSFRPNGGQLYVIGFDTDTIYEYSVGSAWNIEDTFVPTISDITRNADISSVPTTTDVDLRVTFDGTQGVDFPSVNYVARRYNR